MKAKALKSSNCGDVFLSRRSNRNSKKKVEVLRLKKLKKAGIYLNQVSSCFYDRVFSRYLDDKRKILPKGVGIRSTVALARVACRIQMFCPRQAWKGSLIDTFSGISDQELERDWPKRPFALVHRYLESRLVAGSRADQALTCTARTWMSYLDDSDKRKMWSIGYSAGLAFCRDACKIFPHQLRLEHLLMCQNLEFCTKRIPKEVCDEVLERAYRYPDHPLIGRSTLTDQLTALGTEPYSEPGRLSRSRALAKDLARYGLTPSTLLCEAYTHGRTSNLLQEVVAITRLEQRLLSVSAAHFSHNRKAWLAKLRALVFQNLHTWHQSAEIVIHTCEIEEPVYY